MLAPEFRFTGPYDDGIDRAAFFARGWPNGDRISGFEIQQITADNDGAFITYLCTTKEVTLFRNTEHLTVKSGQITSANVYFGASFFRNGAFVGKAEEGY